MASGPNLKRIGGAGTGIFAGQIAGYEDNRRLRADLARGTPLKPGEYDRMAAQDPQIAGMLRVTTSLLVGAGASIVPPDGADDREQEIAEFVQEAWAGQRGGARTFLRLALTMCRSGFALFEEVHRRRADGRIVWEEFGFRPQRNVYGWEVGPDDELAFVELDGYRGGDKWERYKLPASTCTLIVLGREGNNFEGVSLLRPAYTPWLAKREAIRGTAIDVERQGAGFMKAWQTVDQGGVDAEDDARIAEVARNWRQNEGSYVALPYGWGFDIIFPAIPFDERVSWIRYLDQQIATAFLTTFMVLGLDKAGTQALGGTLFSAFVLAIGALAATIEDAMNEPGGETVNGAIARLVDLNFGPQERYPRLVFGRIDPGEAPAQLAAITGGVSARIFGEWGSADANAARTLAGLPALDEAAEAAQDDEPEPKPTGEVAVDPEPEPTALARRATAAGVVVRDALGTVFVAPRSLMAHERAVAFGSIAKMFDRGQDGFGDAVREPLQRGAAGMVKQLTDILRSERTTEEMIEAVAGLGISAGSRLEIERAVREHLLGVADAALKDARAEVGRQIARGGRQERQDIGRDQAGARVQRTPVSSVKASAAEAIASSRAKIAAKKLIDEIEVGIRDGGMLAAQGGGTASQGFRDAAAVVANKADSAFRRIGAAAISTTIGRARESGSIEALEKAGIADVEAVLFSALLDDATCEPCAAADGTTFAYGSADYWRFMPPFGECDGRGLCRCIQILLGAESAEAIEGG